jgi:Uma2 family endonuclease
MASQTRSTLAIPWDEVPIDRSYRLSVDQYHRMAEVGILTADDRVELLEGVIYVKEPSGNELDTPIYRLSVDQYHHMIREGILGVEDRVELLEGRLVTKMAINPPHRIATDRTRTALERIVPAGWYVEQQNPIATGESEPEPDIAVVRDTTDDYPDRHPGPSDLALVAEVADTSLSGDRGFKKSLYSRASIPIYWIINLPERQVEVYSDPSGPMETPDFRRRQDHGVADTVPLVIEGREVARIAVRDLLP